MSGWRRGTTHIKQPSQEGNPTMYNTKRLREMSLTFCYSYISSFEFEYYVSWHALLWIEFDWWHLYLLSLSDGIISLTSLSGPSSSFYSSIMWVFTLLVMSHNSHRCSFSSFFAFAQFQMSYLSTYSFFFLSSRVAIEDFH